MAAGVLEGGGIGDGQQGQERMGRAARWSSLRLEAHTRATRGVSSDAAHKLGQRQRLDTRTLADEWQLESVAVARCLYGASGVQQGARLVWQQRVEAWWACARGRLAWSPASRLAQLRRGAVS